MKIDLKWILTRFSIFIVATLTLFTTTYLCRDWIMYFEARVSDYGMFSDDYSEWAFSEVELGMSIKQVKELLGEPLKQYIAKCGYNYSLTRNGQNVEEINKKGLTKREIDKCPLDSFQYYYFVSKSYEGDSLERYIVFDSTGHVKEIVRGIYID